MTNPTPVGELEVRCCEEGVTTGVTELSWCWSSYTSKSRPGCLYYFNSYTGEKRWDFPPDLDHDTALSPTSVGGGLSVTNNQPSFESVSVPSTPSVTGLDLEKPNLPLPPVGLFKDDPNIQWKLRPVTIMENTSDNCIPYAKSISLYYEKNYTVPLGSITGTIINHETLNSCSEEPSDYIEPSSDTVSRPSPKANPEYTTSKLPCERKQTEEHLANKIQPTTRRKLNRSAPVMRPDNFSSARRPRSNGNDLSNSLPSFSSSSFTATSMSSSSYASTSSPSNTINPRGCTIPMSSSSSPITGTSGLVPRKMTSSKAFDRTFDSEEIAPCVGSISTSLQPGKRKASDSWNLEDNQHAYKKRYSTPVTVTNVNSGPSSTGTCKAASRLKALQDKLAKNQILADNKNATASPDKRDKVLTDKQKSDSRYDVLPEFDTSESHLIKPRATTSNPAARQQAMSGDDGCQSTNFKPTSPLATDPLAIPHTVSLCQSNSKVEERLPSRHREPCNIPRTQATGPGKAPRTSRDRRSGPTLAADRLAVLQRNLQRGQKPADTSNTVPAPIQSLLGMKIKPTSCLTRSDNINPPARKTDSPPNNARSPFKVADARNSAAALRDNVTSLRGNFLPINSASSRNSVSPARDNNNVTSLRGNFLPINSASSRNSVSPVRDNNNVPSLRGNFLPINSASSCDSVSPPRENITPAVSGVVSRPATRVSVQGRLNSKFKYNGPANWPVSKPATVVGKASIKYVPMEQEDSKADAQCSSTGSSIATELMDWEPSETEQNEMITDINAVRKILGYRDLFPRTLTDDSLITVGQVKANYFVVLDSNILMGHLKFVEHLRDQQYAVLEPLVLVVPWAVIQELDKLKDGRHDKANLSRETLSKQQARLAVNWLNQQLTSNHPRVKGQTSFDLSAVQFHCKVADDSILKCCQQMLPFAKNVVLLTNDNNLRNKALMVRLQAKSRDELQAALNNLRPTAAVAPLPASSSSRSVGRQTNVLDAPENKDAALADNILCQLRPLLIDLLGTVLQQEMVNAFGNMWTNVVRVKPPWIVVGDVIVNYLHHWIALASDIFPNSAKLHFKALDTFFNSKQAKSYNHSLREVGDALDASVALCRHVVEHGRHEHAATSLRKLTELKHVCSGRTQPTVEAASPLAIRPVVTDSTLTDEARYKEEFLLIKRPLQIIWDVLIKFCVESCEFLKIKHQLVGYPGPLLGVTPESIRERLFVLAPMYHRLINSLTCLMNVPVEQLYSNDAQTQPAIVAFHRTLTEINLTQDQTLVEDLPNNHTLYRFCVSKNNREILTASMAQFNEFGRCMAKVMQELDRQFPQDCLSMC